MFEVKVLFVDEYRLNPILVFVLILLKERVLLFELERFVFVLILFKSVLEVMFEKLELKR